MKILLVGGNAAVRGGVELFCERAFAALTEIGGHRVERIQSNTAFLTFKRLGLPLRCIRQLFLARGQWDCVWLQYVNFPELLLLAICRVFGYRVLVTPHLGANWASQSRPVLRWTGLKLLGLASGLALLSATQDDELSLPPSVPRYAIKTFLPRTFPAHVHRTAPDGSGLALLHAGRLSEGKGTFAFLDVCSRLKDANRPFSARIIGNADQETRQRISAIIQERGLETSVTMLGAMPETSMMAALASADILVHLSDIDSFPLIVLEAIGCGVFPICKDLPGARLMTQNYCGHIVAGSAAASLAADYLCGTSVTTQIAAAHSASRRVAADYAWSACVTVLEAALKAVCV